MTKDEAAYYREKRWKELLRGMNEIDEQIKLSNYERRKRKLELWLSKSKKRIENGITIWTLPTPKYIPMDWGDNKI